MSEYLFSFEGRSGRISYLGFWFVWGFLIAAAVALSFFVFGGIAILLPLFFILPFLITISSLAVQARRLHDMGISAFAFLVIGPIYFLPSVFLVLEALNIVGKGYTDTEVWQILNFSCAAFMYAYNCLLLLWPGEKGDNRFD